MGIGILSGTRVIIGDSETRSLCKERGFGEDGAGRAELSLIEALFLLESENLEVTDGKKKLGFDDLLKIGAASEENFYAKYKVYSDMRGRGLLVRTGFKFGADFRVYERGSSVGRGHSNRLVHVVPEEYTCSFPDISRAVRLSGNVKKEMIYAIVDEEGDITYYLIDRVKM
ncbi:MAG: tRNA-intron lyase [Candidatus Altiarchaeales archaeon IMC4]|nr:MAG: tRNA-intron lyase [Candidatus Altiarchaeales archaeon IMC4]